ncbi:MAG: membrane protein insertion efficiency factor YidD [Clostridia bacterium]|nr:membrane protein insertion efficiency factor YidD [Clostridia bacterium]
MIRAELDFFRKEYAKQKKLEEIVRSRVPVRPNIKKWQVAISFAALPFLLFAVTYLTLIIPIDDIVKILLTIVVDIVTLDVYLSFCLINTVKCYQHYAKEETRRRCKCIPSCSEYALLSLKSVFPLLLALLKIRKRLFVTCNGEEYKIDFPTRKMGEEFENKLQ